METNYMINRSIYYWSGVYRSNLQKRMAYRELRTVIAINILNFDLLNDTKRFHTSFHLYEDKDFFKLTNMMEFHFVEMPKLINEWKQGKLDPWNDLLARWLLLLGIVDSRTDTFYEDIYNELEAIAMKDDVLKSAFKNWDYLSATQEERLAYEARLKHVLDEEAAIREAELREKEALERGLQKGIQQGMKQGIEQGIEQGQLEKAKEIAQKMLKKGLDIESVMELTGLSSDAIEILKRNIE
ncbi:Rpn family recombination-promoting nuclease/putative transposase [Heyndrickxia sporothermodurans]|uniref:Rpn family recombination-promoting nuclease/putative transposase n=1 Tax=Heyndrickxia sporothermodurans TaxID=46224 RepID=UPI002E1A5542|nr:Rpn family recombination-promoting nuclease/putative transposase [Heyndrickxia sporothermodurans]MED3653715.1 Rpn family recombination-promoting nuclease/putative transposase [Heyndrickxia sporothermodurans]MED3697331.1 Rpn family recombination-promoting nuclease/putative transposase [Heyndrickxia sporothermodurans]MED3780786.1 Rpn family recombination-promoting nuclease/putative transposase [Heyndrickxia sporothermodurans]